MDPDRWEILDDVGLVVGQIARGFKVPLARPRPTPVFWSGGLVQCHVLREQAVENL